MGDELWVRPPQMEVVDATGAGDAFKAGVIYGLWRGWELEQAMGWGVAAGSLNTRYRGRHQPPAGGGRNRKPGQNGRDQR